MSGWLAFKPISLIPRFCRTLVNHAALRPVPPATSPLSTPEAFLKAIGRKADTKVKAESWEDLWAMNRLRLKEAGVDTKDRRYILWCMAKFRQGLDPVQFAHPPKPRKKIRGHGPAVQNGKRIRSKRR
ncbi:IGR protein motif-domain-containing protein [Fomitopsis betulina]|nr:IGR protein motif-domain-containing protein [Fomitopsis betulina]